MKIITCPVALLALVGFASVAVSQEPIAHWPLTKDAKDSGKHGLHGALKGRVSFEAASNDRPTASFDGRNSYIEVPTHEALKLGTSDFSIAVTLKLDERGDDLPGDVLSLYDAKQRRGLHLTVKTNSGVTTCQANARQLQFGIDNGRDSEWTDCGRPGGERSILPFALVVHRGQLFAGTCEPQHGDAGHVYRYGGGQEWIDCGAPAACNSVSALISYGGQLYAGVAKYRTAGSSLVESENPNLGGRIFRYDGDKKWTDCGGLPGSPAIGGMTVYKGKLYAASLYAPAGFYRYEGEQQWIDCGVPNGKRVESLCVFDGYLFATSYDGGNVYRYDGESWTDLGVVGQNTQCYGFAAHRGQLHVSTWPSGRVFRFDGPNQWFDTGRLGEELEVMGLVVHNGRLLGGTLPLAEVHQYDGDNQWKKLVRLDHTPDVKYRRVWTMAEYQGRTYWGVLPSGRVWSFGAGQSVTWDDEFPSGWHEVRAARQGTKLKLWVDGKQVAESTAFKSEDYVLDTAAPLLIGGGETDSFYGQMRDVKLTRGAP